MAGTSGFRSDPVAQKTAAERPTRSAGSCCTLAIWTSRRWRITPDASRSCAALIRAFPNPLWILAKYLKETSGAPIRPKGIITVGEPLLDSQRTLFEEVFGCPLFNCYVSRECGNMAGECDFHHGLHINAESLIIEFVRNGRQAGRASPGQILITDLDNYGMPFIRYRIEDLGSSMSPSCPCGRSLPLMAMEAGRISDFIISPHDRSYVSGAALCHYLIAEGPEVGQVQLVQESIDQLTIRIVRSRSTGIDERQHFEQVIQRVFQGKVRLRLNLSSPSPRKSPGNTCSAKAWSNTTADQFLPAWMKKLELERGSPQEIFARSSRANRTAFE